MLQNHPNLVARNSAAGGFYPYTIDNSCRFNDNDSPRLYRTQGTPTDQDVWTFSIWVKRSTITSAHKEVFSASSNSSNYERFFFLSGDDTLDHQVRVGGADAGDMEQDRTFRDTSAWMHLVLTRNGTGTSAGKLYVNGVLQSTTNTSYSSSAIFINGSGYVAEIGGVVGGANPFDGYFAEAVFIDGTAYDATDLGEDKNGVWVPKNPSGLTFGNNGFYLDFADSSNLGNDVSGNNNDFTSSGLSSNDQMIDTPTNNFYTAAIMSGSIGYTPTMSEGNLKSTNSNSQRALGIGLPTSGEWYWEIQSPNVYSGSGYRYYVGLAFGTSADESSLPKVILAGGGAYVGIDYQAFGTNYGTGSNSGGPGDVCGLYLNADAQEFSMYVADTLVATVDISSADLSKMCFYHGADGTPSRPADTILHFNFGQNGDFNGAETAQGNTDANGVGDFYYTPKGNSLALCTANLPEPTVGPNSTTTSGENFNTVLYTGNGSTQSVTGVNFQPDFTWIKDRDAAYGHQLYDVLRGAENTLRSDSTVYEYNQGAQYGALTSFDSDGFSVDVGSDVDVVNTTGNDYVSWNWKANGAGVSNTDGSITSTVSANTDAGFSIVSYTGNGSNSQTVGPGLGSSPDVVILKDRDTNSISNRWTIFHSAVPTQNGEFTNSAFFTFQGRGSITAVSSSTFTLYGSTDTTTVNESGDAYIAYCFAEVEGFSSFGSYTGNGSTDGPFIYTGFRPAFVIFKRTDAANNWNMFDSKRDTYNAVDHLLYPYLSNAEYTATEWLDFTSNGIKIRTSNSDYNASGGTWVYICFAENPFKYSNAR